MYSWNQLVVEVTKVYTLCFHLANANLRTTSVNLNASHQTKKKPCSIYKFNVVSWQTSPRRQICFLKSINNSKANTPNFGILLFYPSEADISLHLPHKKLASIFNLFIELALCTKHGRIPILNVHSCGRGPADTYFSTEMSMWERLWEFCSAGRSLGEPRKTSLGSWHWSEAREKSLDRRHGIGLSL